MENQKLIEMLKAKGYAHKLTKSGVVVTHQGHVDLRSLTTLPEGVAFENRGSVYLPRLTTLPESVTFENRGSVYLPRLTTLPEGVAFENHGRVDLDSLTTLPEGVTFENHGDVNLRSLTTLPEDVTFENHGYVDLRSLTTLPEGVAFENHGRVDLNSLTTLPEGVTFENLSYVDLNSLTTLPEGVTFENHGSVYLNSLTGTHKYQGESYTFIYIDGFTMLLSGARSYYGITVHTARYFCGGKVRDLTRCYVVEKDGTYAHGDTMTSAVEDLAFKLADSADKEEVARRVKQSGVVTLADFRALTGACREGIRQHLSGHNIALDEISEMPLQEALAAMNGTSYGATFKSLIEAPQFGLVE